jgi:hypothetical protein
MAMISKIASVIINGLEQTLIFIEVHDMHEAGLLA